MHVINILQALYNEDASKIVEHMNQEKVGKSLNFFIDVAAIILVAKATNSTEDELQMFNKAWNHFDTKSWRKWKKAIEKEFDI